MLGIPLRYLLRHPLDAADLAADPRQVWTTIVDQYVDRRERRGPVCNYKSDESWEQQLHAHLGAPWPCPFASEFWKLWSEVIRELEAQGVRAGPESFLS